MFAITKVNFEIELNHWGALAFDVTVITGIFGAMIRWFILKPLDRRIKEATKQIQPGANGGKSLTDANKKIDRLEEKFEKFDERFERVEGLVEDMFEHIFPVSSKSRVIPLKKTKKEKTDD